MRLHANHVSIEESGGELFQVSFDSEARSEDDFDLSVPNHPYLLVQRQFEDDDGGVCYIETHDHDTYAGHYRLRLIEVTPTRLAFEIARNENKYVEVTYDLDAKRFDEVQRIVHIIFGIRGLGNIPCVWLPSVLAGKALLSFRTDHTGGGVGCGSVSDPGKVEVDPEFRTRH